MPKNPFVDDAGQIVLSFVSAAKNLSRVGELTAEVAQIAGSNAWRRYKTATGTSTWRASEFDYFLIASDMRYEDVSRVLAYSREVAEALGPKMERGAPEVERRTLEAASAAWRGPGTETLLERARALGWTRDEKSGVLGASPVPARVRVRLENPGKTREKLDHESRVKQIGAARIETLDCLIESLRGALDSDTERLYVVEKLKAVRILSVRAADKGISGRSRGQPRKWASDAERKRAARQAAR